MESDLEGLKLNTWMMPFSQFWGLPIRWASSARATGIQPFKTVKDYDNWLGRVRGFPAWADSAIGNFRQGMGAGVVLPRALVVKMIPQLRGLVVTDPTKSLFYGPITKFPASLFGRRQSAPDRRLQEAISTELVPTYRKLGDFLKNEYLPKARTTTGIAAVPGGPEIYRYAVRSTGPPPTRPRTKSTRPA